MSSDTRLMIAGNLTACTTYSELVTHFPPRTIHDKTDLANTQEVADSLTGFDLNQDQKDYLATLNQLIDTYTATLAENSKPRKKVPGREVLAFLMESNELTTPAIGKLLGVTPSIVLRILKGERKLTVPHIQKLSKRFGIHADAFIH